MKRFSINFLIFITPFLIAFSVVLNLKLTDSFHEGEYLGNIWYIYDYYAKLVGFPVLVHGAMDFLPQVMARTLFGDNHLIIYTRLFNTLTVFIAWVFYIDAGRRLIVKQGLLVHGLFMLSFLWMAASSGTSPLGVQQAFIGTRDVFLMASIFSAIRGVYGEKDSKIINYYWLFISASAAAASLYWSYDRGIMALVFIAGLSICFIVLENRRGFYVLISGYLVTLCVISFLGIAGRFDEVIYNIYYWVKNTSDVWFMSKEVKIPALSWATGLACFSVSSMMLALIRLFASRNNFFSINCIVLSLFPVQVLFLLKLYALPSINSFYFIWPSVLMLVYAINGVDQAFLSKKVSEITAISFPRVFSKRYVTYSFALFIVVLSNSLLWFEVIKFNNLIPNINKIINPDHDLTLVDVNRYNLHELDQIEFECVLQFSNEGVFSFFLKRRYCTPFMYSVYVAKDVEKQILSEMVLDPPRLVIFSSNNWYGSIYGRGMKDRLPDIYLFLTKNYKFRKNEAGYVFATFDEIPN